MIVMLRPGVGRREGQAQERVEAGVEFDEEGKAKSHAITHSTLNCYFVIWLYDLNVKCKNKFEFKIAWY